jgi:hypothetical protein
VELYLRFHTHTPLISASHDSPPPVRTCMDPSRREHCEFRPSATHDELTLGKKFRNLDYSKIGIARCTLCDRPIPRPTQFQKSILSGKRRLQGEEEKCNTPVLILCVWRTGSNFPQNCQVTRSTQPWVDKGAATQARRGLSLIYESLRKRCAAARRALPAAAWAGVGGQGATALRCSHHI